MSEPKLNCILREVRISYPALQKYLPGFRVASDIIHLPHSDTLPVELRVAELTRSTDRGGRILIAFTFDRERKNRLLLITPHLLQEIVGYFDSTRFTDRESTTILVGKDGSRKLTQLEIPFMGFPVKKLVVCDFDGEIHLVEYLQRIIVDVDKAETRLMSLANKSRLDLTSLPTSEKRIKLSKETGDAREIIVLANQFLQIPGITEKAAMAVAEKYRRASSMLLASNDDELGNVSYVGAKGETRRLNARLRNFIRIIFCDKADPDVLLS